MVKKNKNKQKRFKLFSVISMIILGVLFLNIYNISADISEKRDEEAKLKEFLLTLEKEELFLKEEAIKLEDDEYVARYAREKYLYSKEGELIIILPE